MRTTIDVPDELFNHAKIVAAQRRTTLKELVIQGLEHAIRVAPDEAETQRMQRARKLLDAIQASNSEPVKPLSREEIYAKREAPHGR